MLKGFRDFILRGNVVELAIAVVIGVAFGAVVTAFTGDILTPLIGAIAGKPDFSRLTFHVNHSTFLYGAFINAAISFALVAAAVYFFVVVPLNRLMSLRKPAEPGTRSCPECLSQVPLAARRCAFCTAEIAVAGGPTG